MGKTKSYSFDEWNSFIKDRALALARVFAQSGFKPMECVFIDDQINNEVAKTHLPVNRCIKVTIEYSDIPEKEQ